MEISALIVAGGGAVYLLLGSAHAVWSVLDVRRLRHFVPDDRTTREAMEQSTLRLSRGRTTMWDAWLGFNISHGLGASLFGVLAIFVAAYPGRGLGGPEILAAITAVSVIYLILAVRFWFYVPALGIGLATACFAAALALELLAPT